jgi:hypothetical protein
MNYRLSRKALAVSTLKGECSRTGLRPPFGLTSPPVAEMDVPSTLTGSPGAPLGETPKP